MTGCVFNGQNFYQCRNNHDKKSWYNFNFSLPSMKDSRDLWTYVNCVSKRLFTSTDTRRPGRCSLQLLFTSKRPLPHDVSSVLHLCNMHFKTISFLNENGNKSINFNWLRWKKNWTHPRLPKQKLFCCSSSAKLSSVMPGDPRVSRYISEMGKWFMDWNPNRHSIIRPTHLHCTYN